MKFALIVVAAFCVFVVTTISAQSAATLPVGSIVFVCTPTPPRNPPSNGQRNIAQPFSLVVDGNDRPVEFLDGKYPLALNLKVAKIYVNTAAQGLPATARVGVIIYYAATDAEHEAYSILAIMKDRSYKVGLMIRTPTAFTSAPIDAGRGTCVSAPAAARSKTPSPRPSKPAAKTPAAN